MPGGLASNTRISAGSQVIMNGGVADYSLVYKGGYQRVLNKGKAISSILSGGIQVISKGGSSVNARVNGGGAQYVRGNASGTVIYAAGQQIIYTGGTATAATVGYGARQTVRGVVKNVKVNNGGLQIISSGGQGIATRIIGSARITGGGVTRDPVISGSLTALVGAKVNFTKKTTILGTLNVSGATVTGANSVSLSLARYGVLNLGNKGKISAPALNIGSGILNINGVGNVVRKIGSVANTHAVFNIAGVNVKSVTPMLKTTARVKLVGSMTIQTVNYQKIGVYELTSNITRYAPINLKINNVRKGALNPGSSLTRAGMIYKLVKNGASLNLSITIKQGKTIKGTARGGSLKGTENSDIFYGRGGNDIIRGYGGRDVAVYDRKNWGRDVITATTGTMTILFNGVKASEVSKTVVGKDMVINRVADPKQQITVRNWNNSTHNIVFGGTLGQFSKYAVASNPSTTQTKNASREVWKKTGLLA